MASTNENIKVIIGAENKTDGAFKGVSGNLASLKSAAAGAVSIIGTGLTVALGTAAKFAKESFLAFADAEKEMSTATKILENSLASMSQQELELGTAYNNSAAALSEMLIPNMQAAGEAALKLGYDDEAASVSFAKLFSVTKDTAKAMEEQKLAMDLAAYSGRDLESATQALMTVHAGGTKILKEFGIEAKDNLTTQEAMDLVYQKVTGSAETMAQTTAGQLEILKLSWGNLKEEVGASLSEAVTPFITELTNWVQSDEARALFADLTAKIKSMAIALQPVIKEVLPAFIVILGGALDVVTWLGKAFMWTADMLGTVIFKVQQAIEWFQKLIDKVSSAISKLNDYTSKAGGISGIVGAAFPSLSPVINAVKSATLPKLASGGIVNSPTVAMIGEAGPEAVIPLNNLAGAGVGGITLNISGNTFMDDDAAEKFGDRLIQILKKELRI